MGRMLHFHVVNKTSCLQAAQRVCFRAFLEGRGGRRWPGPGVSCSRCGWPRREPQARPASMSTREWHGAGLSGTLCVDVRDEAALAASDLISPTLDRMLERERE